MAVLTLEEFVLDLLTKSKEVAGLPLDLGDTWAVAPFMRSEGCPPLVESNFLTAHAELLVRYPEDVDVAHVRIDGGWVEHLLVRVVYPDGEVTAGAEHLHGLVLRLNEWPVLDDLDLERRERLHASSEGYEGSSGV